MADAPKTIAEMREAAAKLADTLHYPDETKISASIRDAIRAIPLPADDAPTEAKHGERMDYTAAQLQAIGEAYAAAYADAMAERAVSDDDLVEKGARALAKLYGLEDFAPFYEDARVVLSAMRGEP